MNDRIFLNQEECKKLFLGKKVFIFGTGVDAEVAQKELSRYAIITAYIDNNRYGKGNRFCGKDIISLEQYFSQRGSEQQIIVASYRYAMEICKQLTEADLRPEKDFFVWDEMNLFHCDISTKKYIKFLNDVWKPYKKCNHTNQILVPFDNRHDLMSVVYAYCSNYFAMKYDAVIYAYFRKGSKYSNASTIMKEIYNAFNVEELINPKLSEQQQKEAENLCDSIWKTLLTWEDWKNITVYGICFGTTIIRDFLREYIPCFDLKSKKMYLFLKKSIETIVFWYHYIFENDIKVVLLADGVTWDGYIRDIAITKEIPTYALCYKMAKMKLDFYDFQSYPYFKKMWEQLTTREQQYGIQWAKQHIRRRLSGGTEEVVCTNKNNFVFAEKKSNSRILEDNEKIKIIICPHIFEEDCYATGEQIFDNNYFEWLCHLGDLSIRTPNYDWYLKMHPCAQRRDFIIINMILEKYPQIKRIPSNVSPIQLKEEGANFALTIYGTIGHEYPEIGIEVINAGVNPHCAFDFNWNPQTKEEYDNLILHLDQLEKKNDPEGLYQFYSINYLFYDWEYLSYRTLFFKNPFLAMDRLELEASGKRLGTWKYEEYMKEWTKERHDAILIELKDVFCKLDEWKPDILYRRKGV